MRQLLGVYTEKLAYLPNKFGHNRLDPIGVRVTLDSHPAPAIPILIPDGIVLGILFHDLDCNISDQCD